MVTPFARDPVTLLLAGAARTLHGRDLAPPAPLGAEAMEMITRWLRHVTQASRGTAVLVPPTKDQRRSMPPIPQKIIACSRARPAGARSAATGRKAIAT